jgi:hypothetical protein
MSIRVYLLPELKDKFKTACFLNGLNMSDVTAALIEEWLANNAVDLPTSQKNSKALTDTDSPDRSTDTQPAQPTATRRGKSKAKG